MTRAAHSSLSEVGIIIYIYYLKPIVNLMTNLQNSRCALPYNLSFKVMNLFSNYKYQLLNHKINTQAGSKKIEGRSTNAI